MQLIHQDVG